MKTLYRPGSPFSAITELQGAEEQCKPLYDRLGGDATMNILLWTFIDEIVEHSELKPYFSNVALVALKSHFLRAFKAMFGSEEGQPKDCDLFGYLLSTHTCLFRELGLDETHFDMFVACFLQSLQIFQLDQSLISECELIMLPLRGAFAYGAKLVLEENRFESVANLPKASRSTFVANEPAVLFAAHIQEVPAWLPQALGNSPEQQKDHMPTVRKWTCDLTNRFAADKEIATIFLEQLYMDHYPYVVAFLQLAFHPEGYNQAEKKNLVEIVLHPLGSDGPKLSCHVYDRMSAQFLLTCTKLGLPKYQSMAAEEKLRNHRSAFAKPRRSHRHSASRSSRRERLGPRGNGEEIRRKLHHPQRLTLDDRSTSLSSSLSLGLELESTITPNSLGPVLPVLRSNTVGTIDTKTRAKSSWRSLFQRPFAKW